MIRPNSDAADAGQRETGPGKDPAQLDGAAFKLQKTCMLISASPALNAIRASGVSAAAFRGLPRPNFHGRAAP